MEQKNRPTSRPKTVVPGKAVVERRNNETVSGPSADSLAEQKSTSKDSGSTASDKK